MNNKDKMAFVSIVSFKRKVAQVKIKNISFGSGYLDAALRVDISFQHACVLLVLRALI